MTSSPGSSAAPPAWIAVGRIARAHGLKGEVAVQSLTQVESRFQPGAQVFVQEDRPRALTVKASRPHGDRILVIFEEVGDRDGAESLRGVYVFVPSSWAPELPEDEFWPHQLEGSEVWTEAGAMLGVLEEVIHTQANDVWAVRGERGEMLIPALKDAVAQVDLKGRRVVIRELPGLTS